MLHMSSILFSFTVMQFIMAAVLMVFWRVRTKANGLKEMALAAALGGTGALIAGFGTYSQNFHLGTAGIACFVFTTLAAARSMDRLQGRDPNPVREAAAAILAIAIIGYFAVAEHSVAGILTTLSALYAIVTGVTARRLLAEKNPALKSGCRILGVLFAVFAALHTVRVFFRPFIEGVPGPGGQIVPLDILYAFIGLAIVIGWSLGLLWTIYNSSEHQLRAAYEDLERFSAAVAHDLKSPLNAVIGNIEAATHPAPNQSPETRDRFLASAHEAALRMNRFINDLLADARTDHSASVAEAVEPAQCLRAARDGLAAQLEAVSAEITVGALPLVTANGLQLTRVFQNLLDNAVKYRSHDRPLHIDVSARRADDGLVHISIRDNGTGIARADQARVFDRFARAGKQSLVEGDGMGLAECRRVIEKAGGTISVASELGDGATFTVSLPAAPD